MNKKIFTLIAGFLLSVGVLNAQTVATAPLTDGQYYLLKNANGNFAIDGDSLKLMTDAEIVIKSNREAALWQVTYALNPQGTYTYSFTNKMYGQPLAFSEGKAGLGGAISSFGWITDPTAGNAATAIAHLGTQKPEGFDKVSIYTVLRVTEDVTIGTAASDQASTLFTAANSTAAYQIIAANGTITDQDDLNGFSAIASITSAELKAGAVKIYTAATGTFAGASDGDIIKKGSVIYTTGAVNSVTSTELTFQAANVNAITLAGTAAANTVIVNNDITNFNAEIAPLKATAFKFDATTTNTNIMATKNFVVDTVGLFVTAAGLSSGTVTDAAAYQYISLLKVEGKNEYLVVDTAVWVDEKGSPYHKLTTAALQDVTADVAATGKVNGRKYYRAAPKRMAAAYMFDVKYNPQNDSLVITPKYNLVLDAPTTTFWATDTVGGAGVTVTAQPVNTAAGYQQVSLKKFSSATELTLVGPAYATNPEIPTKISLGISTSAADVADIASGVYFINLVSTGGNKPADNGKYYVDDMLTRGFSWKAPETQNFNRMPGAHWVVERSATTKQVSIWNRESGVVYKQNTIFYKNGDNVYAVGNDTLKLTKVADAYTSDSTLGYFAQKKEAEEVYSLRYFSGLDNTKRVLVKDVNTKKQLFVDVDGNATFFALEPVADPAKYGVNKDKIAKPLSRQAYRIYVMPEDKYIPAGDTLYVQKIEDNQYYVAKSKPGDATSFYVKEFNHTTESGTEIPFYALWDQSNNDQKVSVKDVSLLLRPENLSEVRTSTFALTVKDSPLYRRLGVTNTEDGFKDLTVDTAKFFVTSNPSRLLYENSANAIAGTGVWDDRTLNFLGEFNNNQFKKEAALFIDTAYVRGETKRPQYLLAVRQSYNEASKCPVCGGTDPDCTHHSDTYRSAEYLVSLEDSVATQPTAIYETYTRLAFVPAKHIDDNLIIQNSKFKKDGKPASADTINFSKNEFNKAAVQFRLVKDGSDDFKIEFEAGKKYVKIHNGVPVLTPYITDAEVFNLSRTTEVPVSNETISTTDVEVVAVNGAVIVKNAANKKVAISNILGKTLANTVIKSDEATITVPAGIVVVAVEGEEAVKAVVK